MTPRPDMHQHDEPDATERKATAIISIAIVYASGFLMGFLLAAWVLL